MFARGGPNSRVVKDVVVFPYVFDYMVELPNGASEFIAL